MKLTINNETLALLMSAAQFNENLLPKFQFSEGYKKVFHLDLDDPIKVDYMMLEGDLKTRVEEPKVVTCIHQVAALKKISPNFSS